MDLEDDKHLADLFLGVAKRFEDDDDICIDEISFLITAGQCRRIAAFLSAAVPEEAPRNAIIDECANLLDAIYSQGPQRGTVVWGQAWGCGVLDAAEAIRALKQSLPQR